MDDCKKNYASVVGDDGDNYRDIALIMHELGHKMNHTSARNNVMRVMKKFVDGYARAFGINCLTERDLSEIAQNPGFQEGVCELFHAIEVNRKNEEVNYI